jgi:hypothetical protein
MTARILTLAAAFALGAACARNDPDSTVSESAGGAPVGLTSAANTTTPGLPSGVTPAPGAPGSPAAPGPRGDTTNSVLADSLTLRTDKSSYRAGDPLGLTLVNRSGSKFAYNPCTRLLERDSSGTWTAVRENRMCTMIAHILEGKQTRPERTELADSLAAGRYRVVLLLTEEPPVAGGVTRSARAVSAPIRVTP